MPKQFRLRRGDGLLDCLPRRRAVQVLGAIGAAALAIWVLIGGGIPAASKGANAARPSSSGTATVQRRDLIATDTVAGTLGYADTRTVFNRLSGTITALPAVGAEIKAGGTLYHVDGTPVVLFDGTIPAYRTLVAGVLDGPDVAELKRNLINLGFDPGRAITVNNTFDAATTAAIEGWQASLGETQTGQVTLGQVVFLPGARRISAVNGVLGSTGGAGAGGGGSSSSSSAGATTTGASAAAGSAATVTPTSSPVGPAQTEFVSFTTTGTTPATSASDTAVTKDAAAAACPGDTAAASTTTTTNPATRTPAATCPAKTGPPPRAKPRTSSPTATQLLAQLVAALKKLAGGSRGSSGSSASSGATRSGSPAASTTSRGAGSGGSAAGGSSPGGSAAGGGGSGGAGSGGTSSSAGGSAATQILQTTSAGLVVTVQLDATKQREAILGAPVTVQLPDGSTDTGRITAVSSVAQSTPSTSSSGGGGAASGTPSATVPVTITLSGHKRVAGLDQAAVSVNFQQQVERGVLSVPVTALLATSGGGYAVQSAQGGRPRLVAVTPGLFAGGFVQVSGTGLVEGMQVSDSQG